MEMVFVAIHRSYMNCVLCRKAPQDLTAQASAGLPGTQAGMAVTFEQLPSGEVVLRAANRGVKPRRSVFARLRGRATVKMKTEEILALTRR